MKIKILVLILLLLPFLTPNAHAVVFEWSIADGGNGHFYERNDTNLSWHDAETYAEGLGGYLGTITSQAEQNFVWSNLGLNEEFIWLGGTDEVLEGTWKWVTGETFWIGGIDGYSVGGAYNNWGKNGLIQSEPDNIGQGQDYLVFFPGGLGGHNGEWDDYGLPDYNHLKPSIIEYNSSPTAIPEPSTILLMLSGLLGLPFVRRKK
ncbi:MAG TPA: lectin-like protein [Candidatus Omnitrophota bacterium]|nr:lectin-like protein [Candidatus Omnitrophota bacterium]